MLNDLKIRDLGLVNYEIAWQQMREFTDQRAADSIDEIWLLEHPPVYTQGVSGKADHILDAHGIPVIQSNRGGQVTYHGPGQIVAYVLLDLRRKNSGVRELVTQLENAIIALLQQWDIKSNARRDAPGVYVNDAKVAALGLRVSKGCSYHGLSLNVDMDLAPFSGINPCGYQGLKVTQLVDLGVAASSADIKQKLIAELAKNLGYTSKN